MCFTGATTANLPAGVLYRVKATYKYVQEDGDELSFDVGDIINVIEYDDPEDQVSCFSIKFKRFTLTLLSFFRRKAGWWEWEKAAPTKECSQPTSHDHCKDQQLINFIQKNI